MGVRRTSPYARLFAIPGARAFCLSGAVARLPMSMMSLGIVLALNHVYDNWTVAGTMSAVYILAVALVTPFFARLFDRFGQRRIGGTALGVQTVSMLAFAFAVMAHVTIPVLFVLAVLMGCTQFSFGALVRTRWAYALRSSSQADLLNAAYALEAAIDELVFILGPILTAFLATTVSPVSQLFIPTLACVAGGSVFFSLKETQPPVLEIVEVSSSDIADPDVQAAIGDAAKVSPSAPSAHSRIGGLLCAMHGRHTKSVLSYPGIAALFVVFVVFNMSFTAFDVSVTALMKDRGVERFLGIQLAMVACGSCIGAVIFGSRRLSRSNWSLLVRFLCLLTVGDVVLRLTMDNFVVLGVFEVFAGLCVSPLFTIGNLIVKANVPARSLTEGLSWLTTAGSVGTSFGSTLAGALLDVAGPHQAMMLPWITTLCSIPLALLGWGLARRAQGVESGSGRPAGS